LLRACIFMYVLLGDMTPSFVTIFSHLAYFSDYLGYAITSVEVFNKYNN
jgi:hypothetical protein